EGACQVQDWPDDIYQSPDSLRAAAPAARRSLSGFPLNGPVANVRAVEATVPVDCVCQGVGCPLSRLDIVTQCGGAQHPPAVGHDLAIIQSSTRMEYLAIGTDGRIQALDRVALAVVAGITA